MDSGQFFFTHTQRIKMREASFGNDRFSPSGAFAPTKSV